MELTKEYLDQRFASLPSRDDFDALRQDVRTLKSDMAELKQTLTELNERDLKDSDALAKIIVDHDRRFIRVEKEVKDLRLKHAS